VTNEDGTHQPTAARFPNLWLDFSDHVLRPLRFIPESLRANCVDATDYRDAVDTDWLSGSCVLYRRTAIESAGGIDNEFFLGEEDIDLGFRLSRQEWQIVYAPIPGVVHLGGRSRAMSTASAQHFFGGRYLFYKKHRSATYANAFRMMLTGAYGLRRIVAAARVALGGGAAARQALARYTQYADAIRHIGEQASDRH
jgi:GT2 family glycosyltransferase